MRTTSPSPFRVMTFNILMGGEDRFAEILAIIAGQRPDLLVLQECLGWEDGQRLAEVARVMGVPPDERHAHLGKARPRPSGRRFHVAMLSHRPFVRVMDHNDPASLGHCMVEAELSSLEGRPPCTVVGAHFDSHGEDERLSEARYLVRVLPREEREHGLTLIAGDLNALTRHDPYPGDLGDHLLAAAIDKYGHPPRFDAMDTLERAGLVDLLDRAHRSEGANAAWATAPRSKNGVSLSFRTDYILGSPAVAERLVAARIAAVGTASDHCPVIADVMM